MKRMISEADSLVGKWIRSRQIFQRGNHGKACQAEIDQAFDLEVDVLTGPIQSVDDAVAKLKAIELAFVEGERTDGADATALRQTIQWLESSGRPRTKA